MNTFADALNRKFPEKKLIIPLMGGLGNQLFQFSFGLYLNKAHEIEISFTDILLKSSRAGNMTRRSLAIGSLLDVDDLNKLTAAKYLMLETADRMFDGVIAGEESTDSILPIKLTNRTRAARGYFQNYKFPDFIKNELIEKISSSSEFNISRNLCTQKRICVHMRYGDYASNLQTRNFHGLTAVNYYVEQVQKLSQEFGIRSVLIVSDEADRAFLEFSELLVDKDIEISVSAATSDQSDLSEIANSSIVVTSNSSFSWWGAWFANTIHNSTIVCPDPWFADSNMSNPHLIKPDWRTAKREFA
jgi:hypothetical protein